MNTSFLSACQVAQRLSTVETNGPPVSQIENPTLMPHYQPTSMPMPEPSQHVRPINSLWELGSKTFFKDHRASRIGDIVMVKIDINGEEAKMDLNNKFDRDHSMKSALTKLFGFEKATIDNVFPKGVDKSALTNMASSPTFDGKAKYERKDIMQFELATLISEILPNGNFVIDGRQEIRLGSEIRCIHVKGIIRREDISTSNSISSDKIQDLRIMHTSRGDMTDMTKTPWGTKVLNKALPF